MPRSKKPFKVVRQPVPTPGLGDWAVVNQATGRVVARANTREDAKRKAATAETTARRAQQARDRRA